MVEDQPQSPLDLVTVSKERELKPNSRTKSRSSVELITMESGKDRQRTNWLIQYEPAVLTILTTFQQDILFHWIKKWSSRGCALQHLESLVYT